MKLAALTAAPPIFDRVLPAADGDTDTPFGRLGASMNAVDKQGVE